MIIPWRLANTGMQLVVDKFPSQLAGPIPNPLVDLA